MRKKHKRTHDHIEDEQQTDQIKSGWREVWSTFSILAAALLIALFIISFVFRSYQVSGMSMENTLHNKDTLVIWKVPRSLADLTHNAYIPDRGDIIVFNQPDLSACGQSGPKQLIKRVIGLPGDRVVVDNGVYAVYDKQHPKGFDPDKTLPYGKHIPYTPGWEDVTLKADQLFVSGDNRPNSCDSRDFGPINASQIVGKLILRLTPLNEISVY